MLFLDEKLRSLINETYGDVEYKYCTSKHNAHVALSISDYSHNNFMNIFYLPKNTKSVF
jgi:hypothetical protein